MTLDEAAYVWANFIVNEGAAGLRWSDPYTPELHKTVWRTDPAALTYLGHAVRTMQRHLPVVIPHEG